MELSKLPELNNYLVWYRMNFKKMPSDGLIIDLLKKQMNECAISGQKFVYEKYHPNAPYLKRNAMGRELEIVSWVFRKISYAQQSTSKTESSYGGSKIIIDDYETEYFY